MDSVLAVLNSDRINRYGDAFSLGSLTQALDDRWATGTPLFMGHNWHRLAGWSRPLGIHVQAGLARLTAVSFLPETDGERASLASRASAYIAALTEEHVGPHVEELRQRLGDCLTEDLTWTDADCAAVISPGLAVRAFADIFGLRDAKHGLVPLRHLNQVAPGVFERDGLLLFAHPYFRRSLSRLNTLNGPFLGRLSRLSAPLNARIALDKDMVGLASTLRPRVELVYWRGPNFNDDLSQIKEGITRHEASDDERALHGICRTEFWWYGQGGHRTFEAEEVVNLPSGAIGNTTFGCRFVHSILDEDSKTPIHMDGAIRSYGEEAMVARLDCDIHQAGKKAVYQKLWRIDGALPVWSWKELLCHYFRDNHLVGEYLGAPPPEENEKASVFRSSSDPLEPFVPYNLRPGEGVQVHVSLHEKTANESGRSVRPLDVVSLKDVARPFIDANTTELCKLLNRSGETCSIPVGVSLIKFGDMVVNFPLIVHAGTDALKLASRTLAAIGELCQHWISDESDRLLSFTLGVDYDDREVWFSFAGHLTDMCSWWRRHRLSLPENVGAIARWLDEAYAQLNELWPGDHPADLLHRLLQPSGTLLFVRRFLPPETFEVSVDETQEALMGKVKVTGHDQLRMMYSGELQVRAAHLIRRTRCSRCGQPYIDCPCSKVLDPDVTQVIEQSEFLGVFWTNRKV
jgi:hypothetical protein